MLMSFEHWIETKHEYITLHRLPNAWTKVSFLPLIVTSLGSRPYLSINLNKNTALKLCKLFTKLWYINTILKLCTFFTTVWYINTILNFCTLFTTVWYINTILKLCTLFTTVWYINTILKLCKLFTTIWYINTILQLCTLFTTVFIHTLLSSQLGPCVDR
jgi:hypothetical protein